MLIAFIQDYAGKKAGQVADLDDSVATFLLRSKVAERVTGSEPVKKLAENKTPRPVRPKSAKK